MIVEFRCDVERPRFWMSRPVLSDEFSTQIAWTETGTPPLAGLEALFELERILLRKGVTCFADTLKDPGKAPRRTDRRPDVVVDFTGLHVPLRYRRDFTVDDVQVIFRGHCADCSDRT